MRAPGRFAAARRETMRPGAVIVGAHANGLGVVRALAARGVPIAVVATRPFDIAHRSRWVSEWHRLPALHEDPGTLVDLLERHAARWRGWAVFATNDDAVTAIARHHERLSRSFRLTVQPWDVVGPVLEKDRLHRLAEAAGLDVPACYGPATVAAADRPGHRFPIVVKPRQHDRLIDIDGAKLFLAWDAHDLRRAAARLAELGIAGSMFEFIPGGDADIFVYGVYIHADGEPSPGVTVRKLRQSPPLTGSARVAEVVPDVPALRDMTIALLRRARLHGLAFAEYKREPGSARFRFVEVNARPVLFNAVLPPTGVDLVGTAWSEAALGLRMPLARTGWSGTWLHVQSDVFCSWKYRRVERLGVAGFLAPYRGPRTYAVWSARDPQPFLTQLGLAARHALQAAGGAAGRSTG